METNSTQYKEVSDKTFPHFLADTWWFAMTQRMDDNSFLELVKLRESQGFTAAQVVVGIPPEVGIENENAQSVLGAAWTRKGGINYDYLDFVRERIKLMNDHGLTAIIYGAWGYQIDWTTIENMELWWGAIVDKLDDLEVLYCLTGESDMYSLPYESKALLPGKDSKDLLSFNASIFQKLILKARQVTISSLLINRYRQRRKEKWSRVLGSLAAKTAKPILIHPTPSIDGFNSVTNSEFLSANTYQTGHSRKTRNRLWSVIYKYHQRNPHIPVINLEPWYEGILDDVYEDDQLDAYWLSVASGASAICYGAHGIWNIGDGDFLSWWGKQTFSTAMKLKTPEILGKTHKILQDRDVFQWEGVDIKLNKFGSPIFIKRFNNRGESLFYIPDIKKVKRIPLGRYFIPRLGEFTESKPTEGSVVIIQNTSIDKLTIK